jgi:hypothetical protein
MEYIDVRKKIAELSLSEANGLIFLPKNFETATCIDDFIYQDSLKVVNKLMRQEGISIGRLEENNTSTKYYVENDITWIGPTIFIAYSFWTENQNLISIGLSMIASYLTDFFKGKSKSPKVKLDYVLEKNPKNGKKNIRFTYEGDIDGLDKLPSILEKLKDE